jgi:hypothetical protein
MYEGQTQFWGHVLSARAGMLSKQDVLDEFAADAASHDYRTDDGPRYPRLVKIAEGDGSLDRLLAPLD